MYPINSTSATSLIWNQDLPKDMFNHIKSFLHFTDYVAFAAANKTFFAFLLDDQANFNKFVTETALKIKILKQNRRLNYQQLISIYSLGCEPLTASLQEIVRQYALKSIDKLNDNQKKARALLDLAQFEYNNYPEKANEFLKQVENFQTNETRLDGSSIVYIKILQACLDPNERIKKLMEIFKENFPPGSEDCLEGYDLENLILLFKALAVDQDKIQELLQNFEPYYQVEILRPLIEDPQLSRLKNKLLELIFRAMNSLTGEDNVSRYCKYAKEFIWVESFESLNFLDLTKLETGVDVDEGFFPLVKLACGYFHHATSSNDPVASSESMNKALKFFLKITDTQLKDDVLLSLVNAFSKRYPVNAHQLCASFTDPIYRVKALCNIAEQLEFDNPFIKDVLIKEIFDIQEDIPKQDLIKYELFVFEVTKLTNFESSYKIFKEVLLFIEKKEINKEHLAIWNTFRSLESYHTFCLKIVQVLLLNSSDLTIEQLKIFFSSTGESTASGLINRLLPELFKKNALLANQLYDFYLTLIVDSENTYFQTLALENLIALNLPIEKDKLISLLNTIHKVEKNVNCLDVWIELVKKLLFQENLKSASNPKSKDVS